MSYADMDETLKASVRIIKSHRDMMVAKTPPGTSDKLTQDLYVAVRYVTGQQPDITAYIYKHYNNGTTADGHRVGHFPGTGKRSTSIGAYVNNLLGDDAATKIMSAVDRYHKGRDRINTEQCKDTSAVCAALCKAVFAAVRSTEDTPVKRWWTSPEIASEWASFKAQNDAFWQSVPAEALPTDAADAADGTDGTNGTNGTKRQATSEPAGSSAPRKKRAARTPGAGPSKGSGEGLNFGDAVDEELDRRGVPESERERVRSAVMYLMRVATNSIKLRTVKRLLLEPMGIDMASSDWEDQVRKEGERIKAESGDGETNDSCQEDIAEGASPEPAAEPAATAEEPAEEPAASADEPARDAAEEPAEEPAASADQPAATTEAPDAPEAPAAAEEAPVAP